MKLPYNHITIQPSNARSVLLISKPHLDGEHSLEWGFFEKTHQRLRKDGSEYYGAWYGSHHSSRYGNELDPEDFLGWIEQPKVEGKLISFEGVDDE